MMPRLFKSDLNELYKMLNHLLFQTHYDNTQSNLPICFSTQLHIHLIKSYNQMK